jgi:putative MATE family efflux protein
MDAPAPTSTPKKAKLTQGPVGKLILGMTIPMIFGMMGMVLFNLVDTFFVGQIGSLELAALSFTFPVIMVIASLAGGLGMGSAALISHAIGRESHKEVQRLTTDSLILSLLFVIVFAVVGILTIDPLFTLLGAGPDVLPLINSYMFIWYAGVSFVVIPMVGNNAIRATGDTKTPSLIMLAGVFVNAILDPILIFGLFGFPALGLEGAAIATVFARFLTLLVAVWFLYFKEDMITLRIPPLRELWDSWKQILYLGLPSAGTRMLFPVAVGIVMGLIAAYGNEAVAAFGIASKIEFLALTIVISLATAVGPFVGQNWAAGKHGRVREGIAYSEKVSMGIGFIFFVVLAVFAAPIASIFTDDPEIISVTALYLLVVPVCYGLLGIFIVSTVVLNTIKKPLESAALSIVQMFLLYLPLAYAGSVYFGLLGIFAGISIAFIISGIISKGVLMALLAKKEE